MIDKIDKFHPRLGVLPSLHGPKRGRANGDTPTLGRGKTPKY